MPLPMHFPTGPYSLKILLASPKITSFKVQIFIISLFKDLLFIGKFQQMVGFVKFVVAGIDEVFFALRLTVVAVRHHQIPVHGLFDGILRGVEGVLAFTNVLDDGGGDASLLMNLPEGGLLEVFARFYGSFGKNPAFVFVFDILIEQ